MPNDLQKIKCFCWKGPFATPVVPTDLQTQMRLAEGNPDVGHKFKQADAEFTLAGERRASWQRPLHQLTHKKTQHEQK